MDRGALAITDWSLLHFLFLYLVPVYPRHHAAGKRGRLSDSAGTAANMITGFMGHMGETGASKPGWAAAVWALHVDVATDSGWGPHCVACITREQLWWPPAS